MNFKFRLFYRSKTGKVINKKPFKKLKNQFFEWSFYTKISIAL